MRAPSKCTADAMAPKVSSPRDYDTVAKESSQFMTDHTSHTSMVAAKNISTANPAKGRCRKRAAEATSHPTLPATVIATRSRFNPATTPAPARIPGRRRYPSESSFRQPGAHRSSQSGPAQSTPSPWPIRARSGQR